MTKEQIEQRAQELYPKKWIDGCIVTDPLKGERESHITGALSRQPEIDQLKERVKELEEGVSIIKKKAKLFYFDSVITQIHNICKQLLTNKPNNNG